MDESLPPIVLLESATKRYHRGGESVEALSEVSLTIDPGESVALVGPSGCGKSTTLNLIGGIDRPDSGTVTVNGLNLATCGEKELVLFRRRTVGFVFQAFYLVPHLTVYENVALPLSLDGKSDPDRIRDLVARVGLERRAKHYPSELSGGEQQRTAVARALVHRPKVLLADEPTGNLDSHSGEAVFAALNDLLKEGSTSLIVATHDPGVAGRMGRIVRLRDGRVEGIP